MRASVLLAILFLAACNNQPKPPEQPSKGPGGSDYKFNDVDTLSTGDDPGGVDIIVPKDPTPTEPLPVVVFLHGYSAISLSTYINWVKHIARRGAVVLFVHYQDYTTLPQDFENNAINGLNTGLAKLKENNVVIDESLVAFAGHSGGGMLAFNLAVLSAADKVSLKPKVVLGAAPGRCLYCDQLKDPGIPMENYSLIPADVMLGVLTYSQDDAVGDGLARAIWNAQGAIPPSHKTFLRVQSDSLGSPELIADHRGAAASPNAGEWQTDGLDYFGTWKILDAMMGCAFSGKFCDVAFGNGDSQRQMGLWSDGTPVVRMQGLEQDP